MKWLQKFGLNSASNRNRIFAYVAVLFWRPMSSYPRENQFDGCFIDGPQPLFELIIE
jgi:hypothetical protein